jgi:hypothetical protein
VWQWICGTKEAKVQVSHYEHSGMFRDTYDRYHSSYLLSSNKRMDDRLANNKLAKVDFHLIFLVKKSYKPDGKSINILVAFEAPNTSVYQKPHKFNELECRIETSKLWMEFYLRISDSLEEEKLSGVNAKNTCSICCILSQNTRFFESTINLEK